MKLANRGHWNWKLLGGLFIAILVYFQCENLDLSPIPKFGSEEYSLFFPMPSLSRDPDSATNSTSEASQQTNPPSFGLPAGTYNKEISIRLGLDSSDGWIFYTLDGTDPDPKSSVYTQPLVLGETSGFVKIKTLAVKLGQKPSMIVESNYRVIIDPSRPDYQPEASATVSNPLPPDYR